MIIVNTATSYFFTNLHAIYVWNGHRERRSSHWYLQLPTRLAERYRWRFADLHSDWFHAVMTQSPFSVQFIEKILNQCKYICFEDEKRIYFHIITECECLHKTERFDWMLRGHDPWKPRGLHMYKRQRQADAT